MRRRKFIACLGLAAMSPLAARAQQRVMPVVGFLNGGQAINYAPLAAAFVGGLGETGYTVGRNVVIDYRWAEGHYERLPDLASELVQHNVAVLVATSTPAALAAKATNTSIPIVFETAADPVGLGLVASLNRPGGNLTGVTILSVEVASKRLEVLHELFPERRTVAVLVNPKSPLIAETTVSDMRAAARPFGVTVHVLMADNDSALDAAFSEAARLQVSGMVISGGDPLFVSRSERLVELAARHAVATIAGSSGFAKAGGLISYGAEIVDGYRLTGNYVGRILRGERPADLPVQQASRFALTINLKTARALGISVPLALVARADDVIE